MTTVFSTYMHCPGAALNRRGHRRVHQGSLTKRIRHFWLKRKLARELSLSEEQQRLLETIRRAVDDLGVALLAVRSQTMADLSAVLGAGIGSRLPVHEVFDAAFEKSRCQLDPVVSALGDLLSNLDSEQRAKLNEYLAGVG